MQSFHKIANLKRNVSACQIRKWVQKGSGKELDMMKNRNAVMDGFRIKIFMTADRN